MNVSSLCKRDIVTVSASASIREAAGAMRDQHVGALAVTDPHQPGRIIGILTDRDLVIDLLAAGHAPGSQVVGSVCRADLVGVPAATSVHEAVQVMQRHGVRRLLVTGAGDEVLGLVSFDDLLEAVAAELDALAHSLRAGIAQEGLRTAEASRGQSLSIGRG